MEDLSLVNLSLVNQDWWYSTILIDKTEVLVIEIDILGFNSIDIEVELGHSSNCGITTIVPGHLGYETPGGECVVVGDALELVLKDWCEYPRLKLPWVALVCSL